MQTNRLTEQSPFHSAFSQARGESRSIGVEIIRSQESESAEPEFPTYEVRIEKRSGKRSSDLSRWNKLGQQGWQLIAVVGKHAFFQRLAPR
jgi:hypothetical protein